MADRSKRRSDDYFDKEGQDVRKLKQGPQGPPHEESRPIPVHVERAKVRGDAEHEAREALMKHVVAEKLTRLQRRDIAAVVREAGDAAVEEWRRQKGAE